MVCFFQDLIGQCISKVVQVFRYLESCINLMINIWGIEDVEVDEMVGFVDSCLDVYLLNGF